MTARSRLLVCLATLCVASYALHAYIKPPTPPPLPPPATPAEDPRYSSEATPKPPYQQDLPRAASFTFAEYTLTPLATFDAKALVLSLKRYPKAPDEHRSVLSPMDIAIGWGPMSNPSILKNFRYYQLDRFFYYACYDDYVATAESLGIDQHIANVHIIPANTTIEKALNKLNPHDIVRLRGQLVSVKFQNQEVWRSSLSRSDQGDGACEVLFLTRLEWFSQPLQGLDLPLPIDPPITLP